MCTVRYRKVIFSVTNHILYHHLTMNLLSVEEKYYSPRTLCLHTI